MAEGSARGRARESQGNRGNQRYSGSVSAELRHLDGTVFLSIDGTQVTDAGLEHLHGLPNLESLQISGLRANFVGVNPHDFEITGSGLVHLNDLPNLKNLNLSQTAIADSELKHLEGLTSLEKLTLADTRITGDGLRHLGQLSALQWLDLGKSQATDAGLAGLAGLTRLNYLFLDDTQITDERVAKLENAVEGFSGSTGPRSQAAVWNTCTHSMPWSTLTSTVRQSTTMPLKTL